MYRLIAEPARPTTAVSRLLPWLAGVCALSFSPEGMTQDDAFQSLLTNACVNPQAELASRCGETFAGQGGISSASQSSLNPNQALAGPSGASSFSMERSREARSRQDRHVDEDVSDDTVLEFGRFSLLLNARDVTETFEVDGDVTRERDYELGNTAIEVGMDYRLTESAVVGAWFDWRDASLVFASAAPVNTVTPDFDAGRVESDSQGGALFAGFDLGAAVHVDVAAGFSDTDFSIERRALFEPLQAGGVPGTVTIVDTSASTKGSDRWATLNLGYRVDAGSWSLNPFVGATWSHAEVDGYREDEVATTGLAMRIGDVETESLTAVLGFDARRVVSLSNAVLIPQFHFEYGYAVDVDATEALASFLLDDDPSNRLELAGDEPDRDFARTSIGVVAILQGGWSFYVDLQSTLGMRNVDRYAIAAGVRLEL